MLAEFSDALYGQEYNFSVAAYVKDGAAELPSSGRAEATICMCKCVWQWIWATIWNFLETSTVSGVM